MNRILAIAGALLLSTAGASHADNTLSGSFVSADAATFTIETSQGQRHTFEIGARTEFRSAGRPIRLADVEVGTELQVTTEPVVGVDRDEHRTAKRVEVRGHPTEDEPEGEGGSSLPDDPASGGAPGGGPPSGGIPGGGVPSGGGGVTP
jgi:hypothetical protein